MKHTDFPIIALSKSLISCIYLVILGVFCSSFSSELARAEPDIKVLLSLPLTGSAANYGVELKNATEYFYNKLTLPIKLIIADDKCDPKEAVNIVKAVTSLNQIDAVIGVPCSGVVLAIAPICNAQQIPIISFGAMAAAISDLPGKVFRVGIRDTQIAKILAPEIKGKKVAALVEQTEFAVSSYSQLKSIMVQEMSSQEILFTANTNDFSSLIVKVNNLQPEEIFISSQSAVSLAMLIKALQNAGSMIPVLTGVFAESPILKELAPQRSMPIRYAASPNRNSCQNSNPEARAKQVFADFEKQFAKLKSNDFTLITAEIGMLLLQKLLGDPEFKLTELESLCGKVGFDENGDLTGLQLMLQELGVR